MKFNRLYSYPWQCSNRKVQAIRRRLQREIDQAPLFAQEIAEQQPSIEEVIATRKADWEHRQDEERIERAAAWRKARAKLFALPGPHRRVIRQWWNAHAWMTREPHFLANFIHGYVVHGRRPEKFQILKYGDCIQPIDYCSVASSFSAKGVFNCPGRQMEQKHRQKNLQLFTWSLLTM